MSNKELWGRAKKLAELQYEYENGIGTWNSADKYEIEDYVFTAYYELQKAGGNVEMLRDSKGRFMSKENNTNKKENDIMTGKNNENATRKTKKEIRMEVLAESGVDTSKFFNLKLSNIPTGIPVEFNIGGTIYNLTPSTVENDKHGDEIVEDILNNGFVFNRRTDGRFIVAQTFWLLNAREKDWHKNLKWWYGYMYQFEMMRDELKRLARMERDNDPEFERLSRFFTKDVVVQTCEHYMKQLRKYVKTLVCSGKPLKKHEGREYIRLRGIHGNDFRGNVHVDELDKIVYSPILFKIVKLKFSDSYNDLYQNFRKFMCELPELPYDTPKCGAWKDAFKAKGAYMSLLNIVKFSGVKVHGMNVYESVAHIEEYTSSLEKDGELWRLHELLKEVIAENNFDLKTVINSNKQK